jgi:hypothetical protein
MRWPLRPRVERRADGPRQPGRGDAGDTLIEVLVALVVLALASVSILTAFSTAIWGASDYRTIATVDTVVKTAAEEAITQLQEQSATQWAQCPGASQVTFNKPALPTGYTATIAPQYWNGSSFQATCIADSAELDTISVTHNSNVYLISVVVDDPVIPPVLVGQTAASLAFVEQPSSPGSVAAIAAGANLAPWPQVAVEDSHGNVVEDDLSSVTLAFSPGNATCTGIENQGTFSFGDCSVTKTGTYTLTATDGSLTVTSLAFTIVPSLPTQLVYATTPPGSTHATTTFSVVVDEEDNYGNTVTTDSTSTVSLTASNGGGGFSCTSTSVKVTQGVATFSNCSYGVKSATGYTLSATSGALTPATAATVVS